MIESFDGRIVWDTGFLRRVGMKHYAVIQRIGAEPWEVVMQNHIGKHSLNSKGNPD